MSLCLIAWKLMENYKIFFKQSVRKDFRNIPKKDVIKILKKIQVLANDPRQEGCIKLSGQNYYRIRQGLYRIVYEIRDFELVVQAIKIGPRSDVFLNLS